MIVIIKILVIHYKNFIKYHLKNQSQMKHRGVTKKSYSDRAPKRSRAYKAACAEPGSGASQYATSRRKKKYGRARGLFFRLANEKKREKEGGERQQSRIIDGLREG